MKVAWYFITRVVVSWYFLFLVSLQLLALFIFQLPGPLKIHPGGMWGWGRLPPISLSQPHLSPMHTRYFIKKWASSVTFYPPLKWQCLILSYMISYDEIWYLVISLWYYSFLITDPQVFLNLNISQTANWMSIFMRTHLRCLIFLIRRSPSYSFIYLFTKSSSIWTVTVRA